MKPDCSLDYVEIPAPDIAATKAFYSLFGWTFTDYGPDYVAYNAHGRDGGFTTDRKVSEHAGPLVVLYATDLDATEAKLTSAGVAITNHVTFEGGRRIHLRDPNGNELAIWSEN